MPIGFTGEVVRMAPMKEGRVSMAELITMALFCGALIVCIIAGISIIPALLAGVVIFLAHGVLPDIRSPP